MYEEGSNSHLSNPSIISQHNDAKKQIRPNHAEIVQEVMAVIQPVLTRVTNEVQSLREELKGLKKGTVEKERVIPMHPFRDKQSFLKFEKQLLENAESFASFENELTLIAKSPNFIKNCWRKIMIDEIAEQLCWKGTETKKSVQNLTTTKAIRNAALSIGITDDKFIKDTRTFFQFAKNRIKLRENYKNNKSVKIVTI